MKKKADITVFEHQVLKLNNGLTDPQFKALEAFYGEKGVPYYSLIYKGVKFCEYVGAIQIGPFLIEILPKADKNNDSDHWRDMLIDMLRAVGAFDIHAPSSSSLNIKPNSILDLYFEFYLNEIEYLIHRGLSKQYRKEKGNVTSLKGSLIFSKHIKENFIHKERFFVSYTVFDVDHKIHRIILKTLKLIQQVNTNSEINGRVSSVLLNFPELDNINVSDETFERLQLNRKTEMYSKALEVSRLLLMNYHPDVSKGANHVLALMFDMNLLWEQFVYVCLRKRLLKSDLGMTITAQTSRKFWQPSTGRASKIRPDIVVNKDKKDCIVLDTKWKNLDGYNPSPEDLRQLFVYHEYYHAKKVALVYPGDERMQKDGVFIKTSESENEDRMCSLLPVKVQSSIRAWECSIYEQFIEWYQAKLTIARLHK